MTTSSLKTRKEFIGKMPKTLRIKANQNTIMITDKITTSHTKINENSTLTLVALLKEGWEKEQKLTFSLEGENSKITFLAFIIGKNSNKFPLKTISEHKAQKTFSYYHIRCALFDKSEVDYTGNLIIKKKARLTDTYLGHHTLMLSKDAKTRTLPCLEIEADDVKAGHAATIGQVNEDQLFYFLSRGIDKNQCLDILVKGFMEAEIKKIPHKKIQKLITKEIENSLN